MGAEYKSNGNNNNGKKRKQRYLPHNKAVKKGSYPLRPGVEGFLITCDGGRERQATNEAINLLDSFYEELVHGEDSAAKIIKPNKPLNKITKFTDSDSSGSDDESHNENTDHENPADEPENLTKKQRLETDTSNGNCGKTEEPIDNVTATELKINVASTEEKPSVTTTEEKPGVATTENKPKATTEKKPIDKQIEAELEELGDRSKRHFVSLDCGCNGVIFIQMHKRAGDPGPAELVQHMMASAASTRKHMSRFILRVLPAEMTCYSSEEEISKAIKPLIAQHFPTAAPAPQKFAVLFEARANTGIDRMTIINAVAKSVPEPHRVDLSNPDKTIIVQIAKTICSVGVVQRYKELAKYNLRQLTSPKT